jgi:hypothetical protein
MAKLTEELLQRIQNNDSSLTLLDLGSDPIGAAGAKDLANALVKNQTLTLLVLGKNNIGAKILALIEERQARNWKLAEQRANQPAHTDFTSPQADLEEVKDNTTSTEHNTAPMPTIPATSPPSNAPSAAAVALAQEDKENSTDHLPPDTQVLETQLQEKIQQLEHRLAESMEKKSQRVFEMSLKKQERLKNDLLTQLKA